MRELHAVTGGVPRLVNVVCDGALLLGYARQSPTIDGAMVREVAGDPLQEVGTDARPRPIQRFEVRSGEGVAGGLGDR